MPRYFFDIHDGTEVRDEIGRAIANRSDIRLEAVKVIAGLMVAEAEDRDGHTLVLTVRDERGDAVLVVRTVCQVQEKAASALSLAS